MRTKRFSQLLAVSLALSLLVLVPLEKSSQQAFASGAEEIYLATEVIEGVTGSNIYSPVAFQGKIYFSAQTPELGRELYVFDGISTSLVVDFNVGAASGMYSSNGVLGVFNSRLLLIMNDGATGYELYQFDGSTISLVVDAKPGSDHGYPTNLIEFGGELYFSATTFVTSSYGFVWDYANPPQLLSQEHAGYNLEGFSSPAIVGTDLYFVARTQGLEPGLVKFDGSSFTQFPLTPQNPNSLFAFNGGLVYYAKDSDGIEPWFFDGTTQTKIADLNTGSADGYFFQPVVLGSNLVFRARTNAAGFEMWTWDGTNPPTMVSDLFAGVSSGHNGLIAPSFSGNVFFLGNDGASGIELWEFDGTLQSRAVTNNPLGLVNYSNGSGAGTVLGSTLYFVGTTAATGSELYAYGVKPSGFVPSSVPQPITLNYSANGGSGSASVNQLPGSLVLSDGLGFNRDGYTLAGWDFDAAAVSPVHQLSGNLNLTQSATIFAVWAPIPSQPSQAPPPPSTEEIPVLENFSELRVPSRGGTLEILGAKLNGVSEAWIGEKSARIIRSEPTVLILEAPELEPGLYDLVLITNFGRVTYQGAIEYLTPEGDLLTEQGAVTLDSFELMGFGHGSSVLTGKMKHELGKRVQGLRPVKLACVGQTMGPTILSADPQLAMNRGEAVCSQLAKWFNLSSYEVFARNHQAVGSRFRSTYVEISWVE
jgi:ELWxxDGT repeat protein